jgi:hypothetical protein
MWGVPEVLDQLCSDLIHSIIIVVHPDFHQVFPVHVCDVPLGPKLRYSKMQPMDDVSVRFSHRYPARRHAAGNDGTSASDQPREGPNVGASVDKEGRTGRRDDRATVYS